jgi:hypothetical protein
MIFTYLAKCDFATDPTKEHQILGKSPKRRATETLAMVRQEFGEGSRSHAMSGSGQIEKKRGR